ncbi:synapse-associated protein 1 [Hylobates moloch]|uniref:synapse-associated protein 1 n=1 Tax=Hylobates moloch TaxID=81572 RepID=UPI0013F21898|nr:synapse-associated protein 1 [Hylobates moloch]
MKYILVTGGVISGIGKGIIASSIGTILKSCGLRVTAIKIDPYINIDAGTFSPYEHDYLFNFASAATKKITESVAETAQTIKKSVEEGKIDGIIDKTIIGDFQKEQKKFVEEQHTKKSEAAVPPWVDTNDEETIQQQILALSADKRNFLRDPPAGVQFNFDFDQMYPVALVMLQEDELLSKMRFALVPKL